jgi:PAS domain S-box-containing protein
MEDVQRLLREIELRQSELERQNEELRRTQQRLEAYKDRYVDLYDFAPLGYVTFDKDGYVQEVNLAGAQMLGVDRNALTGYPFCDYVASEDREAFRDHLRRCANDHSEVTSEMRLVTKSGQTITAHVRSVPVEGPDEETLCKTAITDISERKNLADELEQERDLLRTLIDSLPDYISVKDRQSRFVTANLAAARILGAESVDALVHKSDADFCPPDQASEYRAEEEEIMRSGRPLVNKEETRLNAQGEPTTVLTTKIPLKDDHGRIFGLVAISRDVTDRT